MFFVPCSSSLFLLFVLCSVPMSDVIVVGAGVIGCAVAHGLASAGVRVQVIDARHVGQGASQASAGVLAPYIEGHESGQLRALGTPQPRSLRRLYCARDARTAATPSNTIAVARSRSRSKTMSASAFAPRPRRCTAKASRRRWLDSRGCAHVEPLASTGARAGC